MKEFIKIEKSRICQLFFCSICLSLFYSCSSVKLPAIEESVSKISLYKEKLNEVNNTINSKNNIKFSDKEVYVLVSKEMINSIFSSLSKNRKEDLQIMFRKTKNLIKDDVKVLGIEYSNYVDIDSGEVLLDLKTIKLINLIKDKIATVIEIEGNGKIFVSAKYTGLSASVKSGIDLYLKDTIEFKVESAKGSDIIFKPISKKLNLRSKFSVEILKWKVPWRESIELELADIISPIEIPMNISTEVSLPLPEKSKKPGEFNHISYTLEFYNSEVSIQNENLLWEANFNIINKK